MIFFVSFITVAVIFIAAMFLLPPWLAEECILFTKVEEGTARAIVRGGSLERFVMSFAGHHLNHPGKKWYDPSLPDWEVIPHEKGSDHLYDDRSWLLRHLGLYWVGWPWASKVYIYDFAWNETQAAKGSGKEEIRPRNERSDFVYVNHFTYAIVTDGAETEERLATDELTLVTVAVRNPYRALFVAEDWMRRITAAINREVRNFVGSHSFKELVSSKEEWTELSGRLVGLNDKLPDSPDGLRERYGVEIRAADLQSIALAGDSKRLHEEATAKEYTAEQEAKATTIAADAKAYAVEKVAIAEAAALKNRLGVIAQHAETGITLAGYDAIRESAGHGNTVIWANNPLAALEKIIKQQPPTPKEKE
ncbi:hypothetical protein KGM48_03795 [Patescibacteria group bacterium]|nr:hypothetical protein [Patescibacteria group bacterium]